MKRKKIIKRLKEEIGEDKRNIRSFGEDDPHTSYWEGDIAGLLYAIELLEAE